MKSPTAIFDAFLLDTGAHRGEATERTYRTAMQPFFAWLDRTGHDLRTLTRAQLQAYLAERQQDGWSPNVINAVFANPFRPFLRWARAHQYLKGDPTLGVRLPLRTPETRRTVTQQQFDQVLAKAYERAAEPGKDPYYAEIPSALLVAWETGLRCSDCCLLRWTDVDLPAGVIRIAPLKGRRHQQLLDIPISQTLAVHLERWQTDYLCADAAWSGYEDRVHPLLAGRYTETRSTLVDHFARLYKAAGVRASFHSLRRAFVSRLVNSGADLLTIGAISGQSLETLKKYASISMDAKRNALKRASGCNQFDPKIIEYKESAA